jgi:nucleoside-triphosphatase THEP1
MSNILITGVPKSGKSTLIERVLDNLDIAKKGFITKEVREYGQRTGFEIVTSTGGKSLLASVHIDSSINVSRYFVDVSGFEAMLPPLFNIDDELLYIDEIGQMELYSDKFQDLARRYLDSPNHFLGTLSRVYSHPLIDEIRRRDDVSIFDLTSENRKETFEKIQAFVLDYKK